MIPVAVTNAFNAQLNREMYSSYFYLALSAYGESLGLRGIAKWFMVKHQEELTHAMKFYRYLVGRRPPSRLGEIAAPPSEFGGVVNAFEQTLAHERQVTGVSTGSWTSRGITAITPARSSSIGSSPSRSRRRRWSATSSTGFGLSATVAKAFT